MTEFFEWRDAPAADFCVIGDPVSHSLSPKMHRAAYDALNLNYKYVAIHVQTNEVAEALNHLKTLGYSGVNVTVPHKEEALAWATIQDPFALKVRAANTLNLKTNACINTDAPGFLDTLEPLPQKGKRALMLGAGGSARAIAAALTDAGWDLRIYNRTHSRAETLAQQVGAQSTQSIDLRNTDLILNTTSASLTGEELPIPWSDAEPGAIAYDLMYSPNSTPFLHRAAEQGLTTVDGLPLLVAQGARSFEWWLGIDAPKEAMRKVLT